MAKGLSYLLRQPSNIRKPPTLAFKDAFLLAFLLAEEQLHSFTLFKYLIQDNFTYLKYTT